MPHPQSDATSVAAGVPLPVGIDPDCTIWREFSNHTCTDREGRPLRNGRACWASARIAATTPEMTAEAVLAMTPDVYEAFHVPPAEKDLLACEEGP